MVWYKKGRLNPEKIARLRATLPPDKKLTNFHARIPSEWQKKIQEKADELTEGNKSEFIRYAIYLEL